MAHSLHHQNIQVLEIEMFKIHHGFSEVSFLDLFYNLMKIAFLVFDLNLIQYKFARYFGPVICNNIPIEIRIIKNFGTFNTEIRKWKPKNG